MCYWVRITENRTGFKVSDSISTLDIRLGLTLRVRTDSLWEISTSTNLSQAAQWREDNGCTLETDEGPSKPYAASGVGKNALQCNNWQP